MLDEYDFKLINLLKENSRLSVSELAKLLGLSRQTVKARMERLEKEGVIQKYTIKLSPELEDKSIAIVMLETEKPERFEEYNEIIEIYRIASRKYLLKVAADKLSDLSGILNDEEFNVLAIMPVLERIERDGLFSIRMKFRCDYCGKEVVDEPIVYKYHNKVYVFCCKTCLREFKNLD